MTYGIDKECVYNREQIEIKLEKFKTELPYSREVKYSNGGTMLTEPVLLGFCGKIYPLVMVTFTNLGGQNEKPSYFYNAEEYIDFMGSRGSSLDKGVMWYSWIGRGDLRYEKGIKEFFSKDYTKLENIFLGHKVPIFSIINKNNQPYLTTNPRLESLYFMKVMDPATTFQNIYMYKAGVLGNDEKNTLDIPDKVKLQQHGFDDKSFKTMKGDKKPRRKNRGKSE
jgi:hypothetical protein